MVTVVDGVVGVVDVVGVAGVFGVFGVVGVGGVGATDVAGVGACGTGVGDVVADVKGLSRLSASLKYDKPAMADLVHAT